MSSEDAVAAPASVTLPAFSPADALAWFQRAEIIFRTKHVSSSPRKADYVLAALPEDIFPQLSSWLLSKGEEHLTYEETKTKVLQLFTPTPEERAEKLMQLSRLPVANQRPSAAFEEMRSLATLPDRRSLDLLRVLWLMRLPDNVREPLTEFMDKSLEELTSLADARMATCRQSRTLAPVAAPVEEDDLPAAASKQPLKKTPSSPPELCWYHRKFGERAMHCNPPCSWSKNE